MTHITTTRAAVEPTQLDSELRAALPADSFNGLSVTELADGQTQVIVHLTDENAPRNLLRQAQMLVSAHIPTDTPPPVPPNIEARLMTFEARLSALEKQAALEKQR
jgi:hypothetical protein